MITATLLHVDLQIKEYPTLRSFRPSLCHWLHVASGVLAKTLRSQDQAITQRDPPLSGAHSLKQASAKRHTAWR